MNARNRRYLKAENSLAAFHLADDKLKSKKLLKDNDIPTPETIKIIKTRLELEDIDWDSLPNSFVVKPNRGFGGGGILIVYGRKKDSRHWVKSDGSLVTISDIKDHCGNILDGNFSLTNSPDVAMFEERIKIAPFIKHYCFRGVPDIRVVVYNNVPVMAMLRLPTLKSQGRSNIHQGGIGVGIDIATGVTTTAVAGSKLIESLPGTRLLLSGIQIPFWSEILHMSSKAQIISGIGYLGIDIAIDRERGPIITELNARPGLAIQLANLSPLGSRLERVGGLKIKTAKRGVRIAQDLFGGEIEEDIEEKSGKKVIGIAEVIDLIDKNGSSHQILAKIDTGAYRTTLSESLAKKLQIDEAIDYKKVRGALGTDERPIINLSYIMDKNKVSTEAFMAEREDMKYDMIIGRKDLKKYIVDPSKKVFMTQESLNRKVKDTKRKQLKKDYATQVKKFKDSVVSK